MMIKGLGDGNVVLKAIPEWPLPQNKLSKIEKNIDSFIHPYVYLYSPEIKEIENLNAFLKEFAQQHNRK